MTIFGWKFLFSFHIFAQNIDGGYTLEPPHGGGSNEYPQSMFLSKNKKKVYPYKPQFYYIKLGCKGVFVTRTCFRDEVQVSVFVCFPQIKSTLKFLTLVGKLGTT